MAEVINLRKGDKVAVGFTNITVGLGWEPNEGTGGTFDLDVSAIMIDENRKTNKEKKKQTCLEKYGTENYYQYNIFVYL